MFKSFYKYVIHLLNITLVLTCTHKAQLFPEVIGRNDALTNTGFYLSDGALLTESCSKCLTTQQVIWKWSAHTVPISSS